MYRSEADALAVTPEASRASLIGIDAAVPSDGHCAVPADTNRAIPGKAARTISAPDTAEGTRIRYAQERAEYAGNGNGGIFGLARSPDEDVRRVGAGESCHSLHGLVPFIGV
jgi:hypothetical protein